MKTLVIASLLVPTVVFACINVAGTSLDGDSTVTGMISVRGLRHAMDENPRQRKALDHFGHRHTEDERKQIKAVDLIYLGDFNGAIALLHELETKSPGRYDTAGNLGTAYELIGDNVNALKWITEEIKRNGRAHDGSEWLHAHILKAKIESGSSPEPTSPSRLIPVPERLDDATTLNIGGKAYTAIEVRDALMTQLRERLVFVKPKDSFVADLLFSFALLEANLGIVEEALGLLQLAREYGFADESLLGSHEQHYRALARKTQVRWWLRWGSVTLGTVFLLVMLQRRSVRKKPFPLQGAA